MSEISKSHVTFNFLVNTTLPNHDLLEYEISNAINEEDAKTRFKNKVSEMHPELDLTVLELHAQLLMKK